MGNSCYSGVNDRLRFADAGAGAAPKSYQLNWVGSAQSLLEV
jgi:hypothetical protein